MSGGVTSDRFAASWLQLREAFDRAARSRPLMEKLADALPPRPRILDLAAGTGAMFRALAPVIGRAQVWTLTDSDPELLDEAFATTAEWAGRNGWTVTTPGRALIVHAPGGAWRMEAVVIDLDVDLDQVPFAGMDAVVCSALLDLVSLPWLEDLCFLLESPLLAAQSVDGRDAWLPPRPADRAARAAFRRHQSGDKGFGPALGPKAPAAAIALLRRLGFAVSSAPSDWRIPPSAIGMQYALIDGHARAAAEARPGLMPALGAWRDLRARDAQRGRLAIRIGHRDILAFPPME